MPGSGLLTAFQKLLKPGIAFLSLDKTGAKGMFNEDVLTNYTPSLLKELDNLSAIGDQCLVRSFSFVERTLEEHEDPFM